MLTHAAPQFTPAQLIDAGRRAEQQGRPDLAVRFYRHLTEHFPEAREAAEAHNALGRIGAAQALPLGPQLSRQAPDAARQIRTTARRDRYRTGRALTVLLGVLGWLLAVLGPAMACVHLLLRAEEPGLSHAELLPMAGGAAGGLVLGCGVVLAAHIARAVFDQANAVHHLLALERARLGLD